MPESVENPEEARLMALELQVVALTNLLNRTVTLLDKHIEDTKKETK